MKWRVDEDDREPIPVDVDVIGEQPRRDDGEGGVLIGGVCLTKGDGNVVDRRDEDRHRRGGRDQQPVGQGVGERIDAVVVGDRRVDERAVGSEYDGPVGRARRQDRRERIPLGVGVVDKHGVEE